MRPQYPGTWLLHCHVTDHIKGGMEAMYSVTKKGKGKKKWQTDLLPKVMEDRNKSALFDSKQEGNLRLSDWGGRIQRQLSWNVDKAKISDSSYQHLFPTWNNRKIIHPANSASFFFKIIQYIYIYIFKWYYWLLAISIVLYVVCNDSSDAAGGST